MRFEDLNWMDVETYLEKDDRVMLVLGACEQHGYLSLATDMKIPFAIADAVSALAEVPVAPAMPFGISPYFLSYPGTITLQVETLLRVVHDMLHSLHHQGFRFAPLQKQPLLCRQLITRLLGDTIKSASRNDGHPRVWENAATMHRRRLLRRKERVSQ